MKMVMVVGMVVIVSMTMVMVTLMGVSMMMAALTVVNGLRMLIIREGSVGHVRVCGCSFAKSYMIAGRAIGGNVLGRRTAGRAPCGKRGSGNAPLHVTMRRMGVRVGLAIGRNTEVAAGSVGELGGTGSSSSRR